MRPPDEEVFAKDGFKCIYCDFDGRSFANWRFLQVDHFKPCSLGGSYDAVENLVTSCIICNQMKGAMMFQTREEARTHIKQWYEQMRIYWQQKVTPLQKDRLF